MSTNLFFFHDPARTKIDTLSLHDALPISDRRSPPVRTARGRPRRWAGPGAARDRRRRRSEEHTSELQSRGHLVCRLLLEKKKIGIRNIYHTLVNCKDRRLKSHAGRITI